MKYRTPRMPSANHGRPALAIDLHKRQGDSLNHGDRRGFSIVELMVAMFVLGIAITGLFPLLVMHSRGLTKLEQRSASTGVWYLVPSSDSIMPASNIWARKLGASAMLTQTDPGTGSGPSMQVSDDDNDGYSTGDSEWTAETGQPETEAFQGDRRRHAAVPVGTPSGPTDIATWSFSDVTPGWYEIQATWLGDATQTNIANYTVYDDSTSLGSVSVNQQVNPSGGIVYGNRDWQAITVQFIRSGTVNVQLNSHSETGAVVADGVRIVPKGYDVQVQSFERSINSEEATVHVSVGTSLVYE